MNDHIYSKDIANLHKNITVTSTSSTSVIITVLLIILAIVVWLFAGTVTEKASARGLIFPEKGTKDITLPHSGTVAKMFVSKEEEVRAGQRLALVSVGDSYSVLVSSQDGYVFSMKSDNDTFDAFEPIVSLVGEQDSDALVCLAFTDLDNLRDVTVGQSAQIWPSNQQKDEIGYVNGTVSKVSYYPEKLENIAKSMALEGYTEGLTRGGASVYEISIDLKSDKENPSELDWTFDSAEHPAMTPGTLCDVIIVTRRVSVFTHLFLRSRSRFNRVREWVK